MNPPPVVLAFLQCQWFRDPERIRQIYARHAGDEAFRRGFIARTLFAGCRTGARLAAVFGDDWINRIVWEETSRDIGDRPAAVFPPDFDHMRGVIEDVRPSVVLAFGKVAGRALEFLKPAGVAIIKAPHPAARGAGIREALVAAWESLDKLTGTE
jgi:hypothetical protein